MEEDSSVTYVVQRHFKTDRDPYTWKDLYESSDKDDAEAVYFARAERSSQLRTDFRMVQVIHSTEAE